MKIRFRENIGGDVMIGTFVGIALGVLWWKLDSIHDTLKEINKHLEVIAKNGGAE